ncbi:hypothetical protein ACFQ51_06090 [Streptomyces kaempferi]
MTKPPRSYGIPSPSGKAYVVEHLTHVSPSASPDLAEPRGTVDVGRTG